MIKIVLTGFGRMGREIYRQCVEEKMQVVAVIESDDSSAVGKDAGMLAGVEPSGLKVSKASDLEETLEKTRPDVAVDFSTPEACRRNTETISKKGINMVIGTTGLSDVDIAKIKELAEKHKTGIVLSPNMSIGVNVYWKIVEKAAAYLKDYDIEIIEKHHRFKKDAPSGTALKTAQLIEKARGRSLEEDAVYGRKGLKERSPNEIGIHAVRAGDIVGEHTVMYATTGERIEITHAAHTRKAFARGVTAAVKFIRNRKGFYGMDDVLGLN